MIEGNIDKIDSDDDDDKHQNFNIINEWLDTLFDKILITIVRKTILIIK